MRWTLLALAGCGFVVLWGVGPGYALFVAFAVLFANFASFCILYDRPKDRARLRVTDELRRLQPNTDAAQRLATASILTTEVDRQLGFGPMIVLNLATGVAGIALLMWGIALRVF